MTADQALFSSVRLSARQLRNPGPIGCRDAPAIKSAPVASVEPTGLSVVKTGSLRTIEAVPQPVKPPRKPLIKAAESAVFADRYLVRSSRVCTVEALCLSRWDEEKARTGHEKKAHTRLRAKIRSPLRG